MFLRTPRVLILFLGVATASLLTGCKTVEPIDPETAALVNDSGGALMPEQAAYDVQQVHLELDIDPDAKSISGTARIGVRVVQPMSWLVLDLDPRLAISAVEVVEGQLEETVTYPAEFERRGGKLWIQLRKEMAGDDLLFAVVNYGGNPREAVNAPWDGGFTWAQTSSGEHWIATSNQGEGADLWWPCKDHPSDKPETVSLTITVPDPLVVASNGTLEGERDNRDGTRTYLWRSNFPISNYNVALNIAPYDTITGTYTSVTGDLVPVTYWVLPENKAKGEELFPEMLEHLNFYERTLGPYPFRAEKYGVAETPHLGMEHQSIIAYGNQYRGGPHGYDWLHHHELGHEWWGNLVTVPDWSHFWIHEGLCTYMQNLYAEEREGTMAYHHAMYANRQRVDNENPMVPDKPAGMHEMGENVGNDVYFKGSWVIHMLRYLVGKEATLEILRRFAYPDPEWESSTDGSAIRFATTEDFIALAETISGEELDWLFDVYIRQPELPELISTIDGDSLVVEWKTPGNLPFPMPLEVESDGVIRRIPMPGGRAELDVRELKGVRLDPGMWILKKDRLINVPTDRRK